MTSAGIDGPLCFEAMVESRLRLLRKRRHPMPAEHTPATGQAAAWYGDVLANVSRSGRDVAKQLARLCGMDSQTTLPWRSLADAVGKVDKAGHLRAYTERGAQVLVEAGWLRVETLGSGSAGKTTFYLMPGDRAFWAYWQNEENWLEEAA